MWCWTATWAAGQRARGVRGKLLFQPAPALELVLAGEYRIHIDASIRVPVGGPPVRPLTRRFALTAQQIALGVVHDDECRTAPTGRWAWPQSTRGVRCMNV